MTGSTAIVVVLVLAFIAANLPWMSERILFVWKPAASKSPWTRLAEWFLLYILMGGIAMSLERKTMGEIHTQDWEFFAVTICLFLVFALPGFIYRHDLKHHIERAKRRTQ